MLELRQDPFKSHRLRTHDLGKGRNGKKVFSSDVGGISSDRRIIWQVFNKTIVVLLYGTHAVQDRVKRSRCGAPNLAPPALEGRSRDEAPVHEPEYSCFGRLAQFE